MVLDSIQPKIYRMSKARLLRPSCSSLSSPDSIVVVSTQNVLREVFAALHLAVSSEVRELHFPLLRNLVIGMVGDDGWSRRFCNKDVLVSLVVDCQKLVVNGTLPNHLALFLLRTESDNPDATCELSP